MRIKTIIAGAAIVLAATIGSVSAADKFSTLAGLPAELLSPAELAATRGAHFFVVVTGTSGTDVDLSTNSGPVTGGVLLELGNGGINGLRPLVDAGHDAVCAPSP